MSSAFLFNNYLSMLQVGSHYECEIEKLGNKGEGIAHIDSFVVFIKSTLPKQKVRFCLTKNKKSYGEGKLIEVLKKSPYEVEAKCEYFGICGGCKWQNLEYKYQLKYKEEFMKETLHHFAGISIADDKGIEFQKLEASPSVYNYRNKFEFSFGYQSMTFERDKNGKKIYSDTGPGLGFHKPGKWEEIIDVDYCYLASDEVNEVFQVIKNWALSHKNKNVFNPKIHKGFWRHLLIRENVKHEMLINIIIHKDITENFFTSLKEELSKNKKES